MLDDTIAVGAELAVQGATGFTAFPLEPGVRTKARLPGGGFATAGFALGLGEGVERPSGGLMSGWATAAFLRSPSRSAPRSWFR